jgi:hypothetical protein
VNRSHFEKGIGIYTAPHATSDCTWVRVQLSIPNNIYPGKGTTLATPGPNDLRLLVENSLAFLYHTPCAALSLHYESTS